MDGKHIAIGVLVALAFLLGGLVADGLRDRAAHAQGGVYATYLVTAAKVRGELVDFIILDTDKRGVVFYNVEPPDFRMEPTGVLRLEREFRRQG